MLFSSNLELLRLCTSLVALQLNLSYFSVDPPGLGPMPGGSLLAQDLLSPAAAAMACTAAFVASVAACAMVYVIAVSLTIPSYLLLIFSETA